MTKCWRGSVPQFQAHRTQISDWKREFIEHAVEGFSGSCGVERIPAIDVVPLLAAIGELTLENEFLERALAKAGLLSARGCLAQATPCPL